MDNVVLDALFEPVCVFDENFKTVFFNTSWLQFVGKTFDDLGNIIMNMDRKAMEDDFRMLRQKIRPYAEGKAYIISLKKEVNYRIFLYEENFIMTLDWQSEDNAEQLYDTLTGLPTRSILYDRIIQGIAESKRTKLKLLIFFIDLDDFKPINDIYGHEAGDAVLVETVCRIKSIIREHDTFARYGGDEFVMISPSQKEGILGAIIAKRLLRCISKKISYKDHSLQIGASIGIGIYPDDTSDASELIKIADKAMYLAKDKGKNIYSFYAEKYR